ncbi:hypothetical protein Back2_07220 [Nocardioides baekrokdamisoli]|uniref:Lipoprotein n=1 Tax=Nocardioides baekrokdamisoli TaxID=1804624 RepID=A0A3G9IK44_9ACTN|nr:hypothetical protein Back2_07220 [Nocardioides baekrokdamisoli]
MTRTRFAFLGVLLVLATSLSACGRESDADHARHGCQTAALHAFKLGNDARFSELKVTSVDHSAVRSPFDWLVTGYVNDKEFTGYAQRMTDGHWTCTVERIAG